MSVHFAFPNVNPDFIGCGRYLAAETPPPGYKRPSSTIIYRELVEEAASRLAPAPYSREKEVFEKKDRPEEKYAGCSLHLAYLLALIQRCRQVKKGLSGDIWCTGQIVLSESGQPVLCEVEQKGFERKLQAFIENDSMPKDRLFLVPAAHRDSLRGCAAWKKLVVLTLEEFRSCAIHEFTQKAVITVRSNELYRLISVFFELGPNPYKGLEAFDETDAERFFGREEQVDAIWEKFRKCFTGEKNTPKSFRFLAILGASGSGKSSIARAGFLARLLRESDSGAPQKVFPLVFKPGEQPLRNLAEQLVLQLEGNAFRTELSGEYEAQIRRSVDGLSCLTRQCAGIPLLILIDQFEEIYSSYVTEHERKQFIANLLFAASEGRGETSVVIVLRTDFLSRTRHYPELDRAIAQHSVIIPAMERPHLQRTIQEPQRGLAIYLNKNCSMS